MRLRLTAAVAALVPTGVSCAQMSNLLDGRVVYGSVWFRSYSTSQVVSATDEHHPLNSGAWQDTVTEPLTTAVGSGHATGHLDSEALTPWRIAGQASADLSVSMATAAADGGGLSYGRLLVGFDLVRPTVLHIEATLTGEGAAATISDANFPNYIVEEYGSGVSTIHVSRSLTLSAGSWVFTGQGSAAASFSGQQGVATPASSSVFALTVVCYANCDESTTAPGLNVADFTCFLNRFASSDPYANCDGSTLPPTLNVADFTCFLNRFAAGCS